MLVHLQYPYIVLTVIVLGMLFWRPVWALALLVAIFPMDAWGPRLPVPGLNTQTLMLGVAFAVTVLRFGARIPPLRYSAPVIAFMFLLVIAFVVSIPWALELRAADGGPAIWFSFKTVKSFTFTTLFFFVTYWWVAKREDRQRILLAISAGVFMASVAAIADFFLHINPLVVDGRDRANGLLADANAMAESIGPMTFVVLYLLMQGKDLGRGMRVFLAATYALAAVAMVLSLSRGNWLAFIAANAVFLLLVNRRMLLVGVATAVILLTAGYPLLPKIVKERIGGTTEVGQAVYRVPIAVNFDSSTSTRIVLWTIGFDMFAQSPVWGNGLLSFGFRTPEFGAKYGILVGKDPHNLVVMFAAESGLIGLATLASLILAVVLCGRSLWRAESPEYLLGAVLLAAATHDFVANLSSTAFVHVPQISANFWILYGLTARANAERFAEQEAPVRGGAAKAVGWRRFAERPPVRIPQTQVASTRP